MSLDCLDHEHLRWEVLFRDRIYFELVGSIGCVSVLRSNGRCQGRKSVRGIYRIDFDQFESSEKFTGAFVAYFEFKPFEGILSVRIISIVQIKFSCGRETSNQIEPVDILK